MMTLTHVVGDVTIRFTPPPTARDVLDWTVWIAARDMRTDGAIAFENAARWAAKWCDSLDADALTVIVFKEADEDPMQALKILTGLCNAIAGGAGLPRDVLADLQKLLARKTARQEKWLEHEYENFTPEGACDCTTCRASARGIEVERPRGEVCIFDDIDPRALVAARVMEVEDPMEPFYMAQVRSVVSAEESRRYLYNRKREEARKDLQNISQGKEKGLMDERHLEQLVFEVLGDREARERLKAVADEHTKAADTHEKASKKQAEAAKKAAEETKKTAKIAGAALVALGKLALEASANLEEAQGRVERSARKQRVTMTQLEAALTKADERSRRLGVGQVETRTHMSALIDVTGQATKAAELYALAQDIAATGDVDLAQATDLLTRAYKGEVEELKKLDGISKQQAELLAGISSESERARVATDLLTEAYRGAADELRGSKNDWQNIKEAATDLLAVIGGTGTGLVNAFSQMFGIIEENESLLTRFSTGLRNFADDSSKAAGYLQDYLDYRSSLGFMGTATPEGFAEFMSDRDTMRAQGRAADDAATWTGETDTGYKIRRGGGRGGYGGGRGGHRDVRTGGKSRTSGKPGRDTRLDGFSGEFDGHIEADAPSIVAWREAQKSKTQILEEESAKRIELYEEERDRAAEAESYLNDLRAKTKEIEQADTDAKKKAAKEREEYVGASLNAASQLTSAFIKDEGAKAVILGGIEVGKAIAAAFTNPPAAITHGAAAVQFFAVAAQAGVGGGGGAKGKIKKGAGGKMGAGAPSQQRDRDRIGRIGSDKREKQPPAPIQININSTLSPTREQVRGLTDEMERELRSRTGGFWGPYGGGR